jgi:hypothetical protein
VGTLLAFPVVLAAAGDPADALTSSIGTPDAWFLLRLAPGSGPGTWAVAAFLPLAAIVCFAGAGDPQRGRAWRALFVAVAGTVLAWASVAGHLPVALTNAPAWLAAAAVAESALVAYGLSTFATGLGRQAFGARQLGVAVLTILLSVGIAAQALQVTFADWAIRPGGLPPAWPVIASSSAGEFRILWVGTPNGARFPAPGGDPIGLAEAGEETVRFGLTDREGVTALDEGRARSGPGYDELHGILETSSVEAPTTWERLGPFGVRYLIAQEGDLPPGVVDRLSEQMDLDRVPAGGLTIFRNAAALPTAFVSANAPVPDRSDPGVIEASPDVVARTLEGGGETFMGSADAAGHVVVSEQFDAGWRVDNAGEVLAPFAGYGWAIAAPVQPGEVTVRYTRQWLRTAELVLLALLWVVALWVTRQGPVRRLQPLARSSSRYSCSRRRTPPGVTPHADPRPRCRRSGAWFCPHGGGREGWEVELQVANPGERTASIRVLSLGQDKPGEPETFEVPPGEFVRIPVPPRGRERSSMVEWFGQWVAVGWLAHAGGGEGGVAAEPCAPAAGGRWYLPDGTTDVDEDDDYVIVMNPFAREAVFSISLLSERKEPVRHGSLTDVVLRPFRSAAFNVNDVVLGEPTVSALVEVSVGRVAAATLGVSGAGGIRSALGYLGQPADTLTFPGGDDSGRTDLVVMSAGTTDEARVSLGGDILGEGEPQAFAGLVDATCRGVARDVHGHHLRRHLRSVDGQGGGRGRGPANVRRGLGPGLRDRGAAGLVVDRAPGRRRRALEPGSRARQPGNRTRGRHAQLPGAGPRRTGHRHGPGRVDRRGPRGLPARGSGGRGVGDGHIGNLHPGDRVVFARSRGVRDLRGRTRDPDPPGRPRGQPARGVNRVWTLIARDRMMCSAATAVDGRIPNGVGGWRRRSTGEAGGG